MSDSFRAHGLWLTSFPCPSPENMYVYSSSAITSSNIDVFKRQVPSPGSTAYVT